MKQTITLAVPNTPVIELPREAASKDLTPRQRASLEEIERRHGGAVPITLEEYLALTKGDSERLLKLAADKESNLGLLIYVDEVLHEPARHLTTKQLFDRWKNM
jgi:hypothetical protein